MAMNRSALTKGVFLPISLLVVTLPLLAVLGGCSLFGIATKGNLEDLAQQQEQQHQELQAEVQESEKKMDGRLAQVEDQSRQLDQDLARYATEIESAKLQLQAILLDLEEFEEGLQRASRDSRKAMQVQYDAILSERDRIRIRLNELDKLIMSWEQQPLSEPEGTLTPVPGGLMVPEQEQETGSSTDADAASSETSVWKNRGADASSR
jgi:hypothetical protein